MSKKVSRKISFRTQKNPEQLTLIPELKLEEEMKVIEEALTTTFDKVISILNEVHSYLLNNNKKLADDINFVISIIKSKKLYKYQGLDESFSYNKKNNSIEMENIIGYLNKFSKKKEFTNSRKNFQTSKIEINTEIHDKFHLNNIYDSNIINRVNTPKIGNIFDFYHVPSQEEINDELIFDNSSDDDDNNNINLELNINKPNTKKSSFSKMSSKKNSSTNSLNINFNIIKESDLLDKTFNIFQYYPETKNKINFMTLSYLLLSQFYIFEITLEKTLEDFLLEIYDKYISSTAIYHTERHALDVLQTIYIYTFKTDVIKILKLGKIDILSLGISALVHDLSHPGYSNDYLIKSNNTLALLYNDSHILENFHLSETFNLLFDSNKHCNIFKNLSKDDYKLIRRRMIELILSTDMSNHSKICSIVKNSFFEGNNLQKNFNMEEQQNIMNFLLHTADISHCSKYFNISFKWINLLNEEFWREGDEEKEKKLPIGFLCDRNKADTPRSQVGFIKGIVLPTFEILYKAFPGEDIKFYVDNVKYNLNEWIKLCNDENKNLEKINDDNNDNNNNNKNDDNNDNNHDNDNNNDDDKNNSNNNLSDNNNNNGKKL